VLVEEHVAGLQVAVDEPAVVQVADPVGHRRHQSHRRLRVGLVIGQPVLQAGRVRQHQEERQIVVDVKVMNRNEVRVAKPGHGQPLGAEPFAGGGRKPIGPDQLEGERAVEPVADPPDLAHPAATQVGLDRVAGDSRGPRRLTRDDAPGQRGAGPMFREVLVDQPLEFGEKDRVFGRHERGRGLRAGVQELFPLLEQLGGGR
jgi:hypothetical protein